MSAKSSEVVRQAGLLRLALRAWWSWTRARSQGLVGEEFFAFARSAGWKLWRRNARAATELLTIPVKCTRYFEFAFARSALPPNCRQALDVSSPYLFSLYVASQRRGLDLRIMNPDPKDLAHSRDIFGMLGADAAVVFDRAPVDALDSIKAQYDCIWSLSVIEHINGPSGDDVDAVRRLARCLRPGGALILTVPVDRTFHAEYTSHDLYGTQRQDPEAPPDRPYFFQRVYNELAIAARLHEAFGVPPMRVEWFGEKKPGHLAQHIARWRSEGSFHTIDDPLDMAVNYRIYPSWDAMPGAGVCGLLYVKPSAT